MKDIEKWSLRYAIVKGYVFLFFRLTFRKFSISGIENIPKNKPIILAPNHQNALTDALAIVFSIPGQPVFLARADIFKSKLAAYFLHIFKLMPVYRIRDGKETLVNNQDTFDSSIRVLMNNKILCLFPEAAHIGIKSMLPHKKAIPRIVFLTGEKRNFEIDLSVVPVGITYSHYYKFRSDLVVQFGRPIPMSEYFDLYKNEGEVKATQELKGRIFTELSELCVNVPDKEDYNVYEQGFELFRQKVCENLNLKTTPLNLVKAEQVIIQKFKSYLDNNLLEKEGLFQKATAYKQLKSEFKITEDSLSRRDIRWFDITGAIFLFIIIMPLSLYGAILHGWLFRITNYSVRKKINDPQFYSSFSLGISLIFFTIWMTALFVAFILILKKWLLALLCVLISIPCGIIAWEIWQMFLRVFNRLKIIQLKKSGDSDFKKLNEIRASLISVFDTIIN